MDGLTLPSMEWFSRRESGFVIKVALVLLITGSWGTEGHVRRPDYAQELYHTQPGWKMARK